jgi:exodeoxyribonuclease V alpha subunit
VLEKEPRLLAGVPGISLKKAEQFSKEYRRQEGLKQLVLLLASCGVAPEYAVRVYRTFGDKAPDLVRENPYLLTAPGIGAPFGAADMLAAELGISESDPNRIRAGIRFVLEHNERNGHCFIPCAKLCAAAAQQLNLDEESVSAALEEMTERRELIREAVAGQDACYLPDLYEAECETARRIAAMAQETAHKERIPNLEKLIAEFEAEQGLTLALQQREILNYAARHRIVAVTGGPGTGKTTSLRAVVKLFDRMKLETLLAAPTGRAAKRMADLTGVEAATIHRMLGAKLSEESGKPVFTKNRNDRLKCDALIVDECSMIDIRLMHALLEALPQSARLILVGDASQLPSVGPGDVFSAILRSGVVPSVSLTEIFRQQGGSRIVRNAHMINRGEHPDLSENAGDFFRLKRMQAGTLAETVVELCSVRLPQKLQIPPEEIQVLSPTRKGDCGTLALNRQLQAALNPPSPEKKERPLGSVIFREGDRLIQTRNNYDILWQRPDGSEGTGIFNGDIGILKEINREEQTLTVDFDGRLARYETEMLEDLEHAWALTVHKAQGCEYRAVILALSDTSRRLLTRMVLYTAVTRARDLLILVGNDDTAFRMIDNVAPTRRYNALRVRIREACGV